MSSPPIYPLHNFFVFFFQVSRLRLPSEIISFALCHFVHCFSFTILPCFAMVAKKQRLEFFLSCSAMYACDWVTLILCLCNRLDQISIIIINNYYHTRFIWSSSSYRTTSHTFQNGKFVAVIKGGTLSTSTLAKRSGISFLLYFLS